MNTAEKLRSKSADELKAELIVLRKEQFNLRFQQATGQLENTARSRIVRRDIARLKTILSEQKQGGKKAAKPAKKKAAAKKTTKKKKD